MAETFSLRIYNKLPLATVKNTHHAGNFREALTSDCFLDTTEEFGDRWDYLSR